MAEEKKKPWYEGWRKYSLASVAMISGIFCLIKGHYTEGASLIGGALAAYTYGNAQEHKIKNGNGKK